MSETTERDIFCSWKSPIWTRDFISSQNDLRYEGHRQTLKTTCENYCSQEPFLGTHFLQPKWSETGLAALGMEGYFSHRRTNNQTQPEPRSGPTLTFQGIKRMEEHVKWHRGVRSASCQPRETTGRKARVPSPNQLRERREKSTDQNKLTGASTNHDAWPLTSDKF